MKTRAYVVISGRVQGVFYRDSTKQKAEQLSVTGWVKNTCDGQVEAVFEGDTSAVKELITWCHSGPPLANVTDVDIKIMKYKNEFQTFSIQYK